jgi:hypothetical protein
MLFSQTALLLAILPFSIAATTCQSANALPWPTSSATASSTSSESPSTPTGTTSGDGWDVTYVNCQKGCGADPSCLVDCLYDACATVCDGSRTSNCYFNCLADPCSAFFGSGSKTPSLSDLNECNKLAQTGQCNSVGCKRELKERATFSCPSTRDCYLEGSSGTLFCLNTSTGAYTSTSHA